MFDYFDAHFQIILPQKISNYQSLMLNKQQATNTMSNGFLRSKKLQQKEQLLQKTSGKTSNLKFKKHFVQTKNIPYDQSPLLRKISRLNSLKWPLICIWLFMYLCYHLIGRITPYVGQCPPLANCQVYVHCPQHYQYKEQSNICVVSKNYDYLIESMAIQKIALLQQAYGDRQCSGKKEVADAKLESLLLTIKDAQNREKSQRLLKRFFSKAQNQEAFGFEFSANIIRPTRKLYSFSCRLQLFASDPYRLYLVVCTILVFMLITFGWRWYVESRKITQMYEFLRDETLESAQQTFNISHAIYDLQARFGKISEETWLKIEKVRAERKELDSIQKGFLYWKQR